jgi:hypothetical protein
MLPTVMAASQAMASDKKRVLQRLMIDIYFSRIFLSNGKGPDLKKTPAKKTVAGVREVSLLSKERAGRGTDGCNQ